MNKKILILTIVIVALLLSVGLVSYHIQLAQDNQQQFFFFDDPFFDIDTTSTERKWNITYNTSIDNGIATFKFNESTGTQWGVPTLYQGKRYHSMGEWSKILGGKTRSGAVPVDSVTFHKDYLIEPDTYFINTKIMLANRTYVTSPTMVGFARANIGVELMASYTQRMPSGDLVSPNFDVEDETINSAIRIVILFSKFYWNDTSSEWYDYEGGAGFSIQQGDWAKDSGISNDFEITLVEGKINTTNTWYTFRADLSDVISTVFSVLNSETNVASLTACPYNIETFTVHGVQLIAEVVGINIEAKMDYVLVDIGA